LRKLDELGYGIGSYGKKDGLRRFREEPTPHASTENPGAILVSEGQNG
jgi:hypothetical protein